MEENSAITKEQAIKILQDAYYTSILPDKGGIIFDALKLAITALRADPNAPDWSEAPEWANYYSIDADGQSWWHEFEPSIARLNYISLGKGIPDDSLERMKLYKRTDK
jgi:hypothetical protein